MRTGARTPSGRAAGLAGSWTPSAKGSTTAPTISPIAASLGPSPVSRAPTVTVPIYDVAAHAGVSIKTVSRVMNAEPNVREETRDRCAARPRR